MVRMRKEYRELTVGEAGGFGRKSTSQIRIQGLWFEELGFHIGDPVLVKCEDGKVTIMLDKERAEFEEAETRKLQARYEKEKQEIHARYVAERGSRYGM